MSTYMLDFLMLILIEFLRILIKHN